MEPWRVCRPVIADSHHFDEEQDPDTDPIKMMGIRNSACQVSTNEFVAEKVLEEFLLQYDFIIN